MSGNLSNFTNQTTNSLLSYPCITVYFCFFIITVFLLLFFALILYMGHHQWRKKSSVGRTTISHSDVLTYNIVPMELFGVFGNGCMVFYILTNVTILIKLSQVFVVISVNGQNAIHLITCVEHYVAVLHPVQYLKSKKPRSVRNRNIIIVCFWIIWVIWVIIIGTSPQMMDLNVQLHGMYGIGILILGLQFLVVVYCNVSILCSLTRPGPGVAHRDTMSVDLKKRRAFYTITTIMAVLLIRFLGSIFQIFCVVWMENDCLIQSVFVWFSLPSSLVQPLLFLHRAGKLPFCKTQRSRCST